MNQARNKKPGAGKAESLSFKWISGEHNTHYNACVYVYVHTSKSAMPECAQRAAPVFLANPDSGMGINHSM